MCRHTLNVSTDFFNTGAPLPCFKKIHMSSQNRIMDNLKVQVNLYRSKTIRYILFLSVVSSETRQFIFVQSMRRDTEAFILNTMHAVYLSPNVL